MKLKMLFVFYDGECGLCGRIRGWLSGLRQEVRLVFLAWQSPEVQELFPQLNSLDPDREIVVLGDDGSLYQGDSAWIMVLWALPDYRPWAVRLARPRWRPLAKKAVQKLSAHRYGISRRLRLRPDP